MSAKFIEAFHTIAHDACVAVMDAVIEDLDSWKLDNSSLGDTRDGKPVTEDFISAFNAGVDGAKLGIEHMKEHYL